MTINTEGIPDRIWISDQRSLQGYGEYTEVPNCAADIEYHRVDPAAPDELDLAPIEARAAEIVMTGTVSRDLYALIAEVKRLRADLEIVKAHRETVVEEVTKVNEHLRALCGE